MAADNQQVQGFLKEVEEHLLPKMEALDSQISSVFRKADDMTMDNLRNIFQVIESDVFSELIQHTGSIPIQLNHIDPLAILQWEVLQDELEPYLSRGLPLAKQYNNMIRHARTGKVVYFENDRLLINGEVYKNPYEVYFSSYRYLFTFYDLDDFQKDIRKTVCEYNRGGV